LSNAPDADQSESATLAKLSEPSPAARLLHIAFLRRYTLYTELMAYGEYYHQKETLVSWYRYTCDLYYAFLSIRLTYDRGSQCKVSRDALPTLRRGIFSIQRAKEQNGNVVDAVYDLAGCLTSVRRDLDNYLKNGALIPPIEQRCAFESAKCDPYSRLFPETVGTALSVWDARAWLHTSMTNLAGIVHNSLNSTESDIARCRASHDATQHLLLLRTIHPAAWSPQLHGQLIGLLYSALEQMVPSRFSLSVANRLRFLESIAIDEEYRQDCLEPFQRREAKEFVGATKRD
jgi:hypothetical protein